MALYYKYVTWIVTHTTIVSDPLQKNLKPGWFPGFNQFKAHHVLSSMENSSNPEALTLDPGPCCVLRAALWVPYISINTTAGLLLSF